MPAAWPDEAPALPAPFSGDERLAQDRNRYVQTAIDILRQLVERELVIESNTSALALRHHLSQTLNMPVSAAALVRFAQERLDAAWTRYVLPRAQKLERHLVQYCLLPDKPTPYAVIAMVASVTFDNAQQALMHLGARPLQGDTADQAPLAPNRPQPTRHDTMATA